MEEIRQLLKDVIIHDLESCIDDHLVDSVDTDVNEPKNAYIKRQHVNDLIKTYDTLMTHERELNLKERELEIRENELKLGIGSEANKLISTAADTASEVYKTKTGIKLAATAMDFEQGGNMFASQISRGIPSLITKMVR